MKRSTRVAKPNRGEQEPFSRQLANERKETRRLRDECVARIERVKRDTEKLNKQFRTERDQAYEYRETAERRLALHETIHADFARVAPVLRSKSRLRRLWWGIRFGLWGVFGFEVTK